MSGKRSSFVPAEALAQRIENGRKTNGARRRGRMRGPRIGSVGAADKASVDAERRVRKVPRPGRADVRQQLLRARLRLPERKVDEDGFVIHSDLAAEVHRAVLASGGELLELIARVL